MERERKEGGNGEGREEGRKEGMERREERGRKEERRKYQIERNSIGPIEFILVGNIEGEAGRGLIRVKVG